MYYKKKRRARGTYKGKGKESGSDNGKALGDRKKEIQKGLGKENVAVRQISMDIYVLRSGDLGLESEGRIRETGGEVFRWILGVDLKKVEEGRGSEWARKCWEEMRERYKEGRTGSSWEREREKFFEVSEVKIGKWKGK